MRHKRVQHSRPNIHFIVPCQFQRLSDQHKRHQTEPVTNQETWFSRPRQVFSERMAPRIDGFSVRSGDRPSSLRCWFKPGAKSEILRILKYSQGRQRLPLTQRILLGWVEKGLLLPVQMALRILQWWYTWAYGIGAQVLPKIHWVCREIDFEYATPACFLDHKRRYCVTRTCNAIVLLSCFNWNSLSGKKVYT